MLLSLVTLLITAAAASADLTKQSQHHTSLTTRATTPKPPFPFGSKKVRGVSLGGWLVMEPWLTPSRLAGAPSWVQDEWTYGQWLGRAEATKRSKAHWAAWVKESDFKLIASYGLNTIRIPIGYWAYDISAGEPYVQGQVSYMKQAIVWAAKYNLAVNIDLHGAPGSQNGFRESGRQGDALWQSQASYMTRTTEVLRKMALELSVAPYASTVASIELLNEPAGFKGDAFVAKTKQWYLGAYDAVRQPQGKNGPTTNFQIQISDAFKNLASWKGYMPAGRYPARAMDHHAYVVFNENTNHLSDQDTAQFYCSLASSFKQANANIPLVIGEWGPPTNDCGGIAWSGGTSIYANKYGRGACKGYSGKANTLTASYKATLRKMFEVQTSVYEANTQGWIMWTWKSETASEWSYSAGVAGGWIPKNPTEKIYGNQC